MFELISECNNLLKNRGFTYAICGGWALELFMNKRTRSHGDIDTILFNEDRMTIVEFMINEGWNIYEHKFDWIDNKKANSYLRKITPNNEKLPSLFPTGSGAEKVEGHVASPSDEADILDTVGVTENIALGKYYIMRKNGVFLGQGFLTNIR